VGSQIQQAPLDKWIGLFGHSSQGRSLLLSEFFGHGSPQHNKQNQSEV
jgi:hypothetical protein